MDQIQKSEAPKISVIVPVYNTEKYLRRCVDSILAQTFTDFELLLIDDGSKDSSGAICDEYAVDDQRVRVLHKPNGGASSARNLGLDNARGEYIAFVDADDWVDVDYLDDLMVNPDFDLRVSTFVLEETDEFWPTDLPDKNYRENKSMVECIKEFFSTKFRTPWGKRFKAKIINDARSRFDDEITIGEDVLFVLNYIEYTNTISLSSKHGYHYFRANFSSLSQHIKNYNPELYMAKVFDRIRTLEEKLESDLKSLLFQLIVYDFNVGLRRIIYADYSVIEMRNQIKQYCSLPPIQCIIREKRISDKGIKRKFMDVLIRSNQYLIVTILLKTFGGY